jgi:hypothetical protein
VIEVARGAHAPAAAEEEEERARQRSASEQRRGHHSWDRARPSRASGRTVVAVVQTFKWP